ncbi:MAG: immunoglobulin-like domain-containing protein [Merdibacter sp.]
MEVRDANGGYAKSDVQYVTVQKDVTLPTLILPGENTLQLNDAFDAMAGVRATDYTGADITDRVQVSGSVDTTKAGTYVLTYTVTDAWQPVQQPAGDHGRGCTGKRSIREERMNRPVQAAEKQTKRRLHRRTMHSRQDPMHRVRIPRPCRTMRPSMPARASWRRSLRPSSSAKVGRAERH